MKGPVSKTIVVPFERFMLTNKLSMLLIPIYLKPLFYGCRESRTEK
jgi:hypothetical protein